MTALPAADLVDLEAAAIAWARMGIPVFPVHAIRDGACTCGHADCKSPGKHPRTPQGLKDATRDEQRIRDWWKRWPNANIGGCIGEAGFVVVDVDGDEGRASLAAWQTTHGALPATLTVRTGGGGEHRWFVAPRPLKNRVNVLPKVDIRTKGGYCVLPPSTHASGRRYLTTHDLPPAALPPALLGLLDPPRPPMPPRALGPAGDLDATQRRVWGMVEAACGRVETLTDGRRAALLREAYTLGGYLDEARLPPDEVAERLINAGVRSGTQHDVVRVVWAGLNDGRANPRPLPGDSPEWGLRLVSRHSPGPPEPPIEAYDDDTEPSEEVAFDTLHERVHLPYTDLGNARRFDLLVGDDVRWCDARDRWLFWDGSRWTWDDRRQIHGLCQQTVDRIVDEVNHWRHLHDAAEGDEKATFAERIKACAGWHVRSMGSPRINAINSEARALPKRSIAMRDLDADGWAFNARNVTIDLRTGRVYPPRRGDLITHLGGVDYVPGAACPRWEAFLRQIFPELGDVVAFLRRAVGYCLTGDVSEQRWWVLLGDGANGKSTFLEIVMWLLGSYARPLAPGFLEQRRDDDGHPTDVADLQGARFCSSAEVHQGRSLDEAKVKRLTGGDTVKARFMGRDFFEFNPTAKLWLATNHRLRVKGTDHGIWRRTLVVPFAVQIPEAEQDPHLKDKLKAEGPGILNWALQGLREWQARRLDPPSAVLSAVQEYRSTEDAIGTFLEECCVLADGFMTAVSTLHEAYKAWHERSGQEGRALSSRELSEALGRKGHPDHKGGKGVRYRRGLRLRTPNDG